MSYEDQETYVLYGIEYSARRSDSNALSLAVMQSAESKRYAALGMLIDSPGSTYLGPELVKACDERAELEPLLAGMVLRELKVRGLA